MLLTPETPSAVRWSFQYVKIFNFLKRVVVKCYAWLLCKQEDKDKILIRHHDRKSFYLIR